ncbi:MAG: SUMF1/EgtB/PvdO family nonheme iron enzyme [Planctomycetota bacterium]
MDSETTSTDLEALPLADAAANADGPSDLRALLAARGPVEPEEAARLADEMAGQLARAHALGVLHLDLRPEAVAIVEGAPRIDFEARRHDPTEVPGRHPYRAPEHFTHPDAVDGRADLYALGLICFELLTGTNPAAATTPEETWDRKINHQVPMLSQALPDADWTRDGAGPALDDLLWSITEPDPGRRPADAEGVRQALRDAGLLPPEPPSDAERRASELAEELQVTAQERAAAEARAAEAEGALEGLRMRLARAEADAASAVELRSRVETLEADAARSNERLEAARRVSHSARATADSASAELEAARARVTALEGELHEANREATHLERARAAAAAAAAARSTESEGLTERLGQLEADAAAVRILEEEAAKAEQLASKLSAERKKSRDLDAQLMVAQGKLSRAEAAQERVRQMEEDAARQRDRIRQLEHEVQREREKSRGGGDGQQALALKVQVKELKAELEGRDARIEGLETELLGLRAIEAELERLRDAAVEAGDAPAEATTRELNTGALQEERLRRLSEELQRQTERADRLQDEATAAERLDGELTRSRATIKRLETDLAEERARVASLQEQDEVDEILTEAVERAEAMAARVEVLEAEVADQARRIETQRAQLDEKDRKLADLELTPPPDADARVAELEAEVQRLRAEADLNGESNPAITLSNPGLDLGRAETEARYRAALDGWGRDVRRLRGALAVVVALAVSIIAWLLIERGTPDSTSTAPIATKAPPGESASGTPEGGAAVPERPNPSDRADAPAASEGAAVAGETPTAPTPTPGSDPEDAPPLPSYTRLPPTLLPMVKIEVDDPSRVDPGVGALPGPLGAHFYVARTEVTRAQWAAALGEPPPAKGADLPARGINYWRALAWTNAASKRDGLTPCYACESDTCVGARLTDLACDGYRLPTPDEWRLLARAGSPAGPPEPEKAVYAIPDRKGPEPVCSRGPDPAGLCDVYGNLWEWVWTADGRRLRFRFGGAYAHELKDASRAVPHKPSYGPPYVGLRPVRTAAVAPRMAGGYEIDLTDRSVTTPKGTVMPAGTFDVDLLNLLLGTPERSAPADHVGRSLSLVGDVLDAELARLGAALEAANAGHRLERSGPAVRLVERAP